MKMKLFFLLGILIGVYQEVSCDTYSAVRTTVTCCSCGRSLTSDEIHFNLAMHKSKNQFMCQKCQTRGKEEDELAMAQVSEEKLQASIASLAGSASPFFDGSDASGGPTDHFYENADARKLIDEATWELSSDDVRKPRKVIAGKYKGKIFLRRQKPKKKKAAPYLDSGTHSPVSVSPFSLLQNIWFYTFPQSESGPYFQLQVAHGDQVFTSSSKTPARELWCQGPRSVVVTEDGYTYFDLQKNERLFFRQKADLASHMAMQGFDSEFKVLLKDEHPVVHTPGEKDPVIERIFDDYKRSMDEAFERYGARSREIDERCDAQVRVITDSFSKMTAS